MIRFKYFFIAAIIIGLVIFVCAVISRERKAVIGHRNLEFRGVVSEIKRFKGDRGMPKIRLDSEWVYVKFSYLFRIGDSIIKKSGSDTVYVFRKDQKGEWHVKTYQ